MKAGAAAAASAGYQHVAILQGGLPAFHAADLAQVSRCAQVPGGSGTICISNAGQLETLCFLSCSAG